MTSMKEEKTLSKWQTLMKFPNSLFMFNQSLRSRKIWGEIVEVDQYIDIAKEIFKFILYGNGINEDFNKQRTKLINQAQGGTEITKEEDISDLFSFEEDLQDIISDDFFQDDLEELLVEDYDIDDGNGEESKKKIKKIKIENFLGGYFDVNAYDHITDNDVRAQINFVKIQDDSYLEADVFPKGYHCWGCGHYSLLDSTYHGNLHCSCCDTQNMEQEALLFICPICSEATPIIPSWIYDLEIIVNSNIHCPDQNCTGHLHLFIDNQSLFKSNWYCTKCRGAFVHKTATKEKKGKNREVRLYCRKCGVFSKDKKYALHVPKVLKPSTARLFSPLSYDTITINNNILNRDNLEANLNSLKESSHPLYWNLEDKNTLKRLVKSNLSIRNIYMVNNIKIFNSVFGYQSALKNSEGIEPIPNFFKEGTKYNVYFFEHIGNGLVIDLDMDKIQNHLNNIGIEKTPEKLIEKMLLRLQGDGDPIQDLLNDNSSDEMKLLKALHTFCHIFLQNIFKRIGLESFRGKLLLKDGLLFFYEIEDISTGGLYQLTLKSGARIELLELLDNIEENLKKCIHDCEDFCKQCSFIDDYYCRPFTIDEVHRWFPSNCFLSRKFAKQIMLK